MNCELKGNCRYETLYGCENADCNVYRTLRLKIIQHEQEHQRLLGKVLERDTRPTRIKLEDLGIRVKE